MRKRSTWGYRGQRCGEVSRCCEAVGGSTKRLTQTGRTFHESRAQLEAAREGSSSFYAEVPAFLTASMAHDAAEGTNTAATCVALIEQIADLLASTDDVDDLETTYLVRFIAFLKAAVRDACVPQNPARYGSASSSLSIEAQ